ncbi:hypothetical protein [Candidatus Reidiella endopervernicosa]|uniref:hypothetical protein n=1 Tax=Candidatus Reidiella endopervernicosa TaxID=2738883 RepID=UPI001F419051|nr:hypothetical protein [Candidatus Reidiella endopervernicosa]
MRKAEGNIVLEDYERITRIADNHEDITGFINQSIESSLHETPELKELLDKIDVMKNNIKTMKNGSQNNNAKNEIKVFEDTLRELVESKLIGKVDKWIIDGLKTWVRVFLPDVFNIRLYPFMDLLNFHVMSNVKETFSWTITPNQFTTCLDPNQLSKSQCLG